MKNAALKYAGLLMCLFVSEPVRCETIKRYMLNGRNSGIGESRTVRSLLKCSVLFEESSQYLSFNYRKNDKTCELSTLYPESSKSEFDWAVYAPILDGSWGNWLSWGPCSVRCGTGQRSRSRLCNSPPSSNGGKPCQGTNTQTQTCNGGSCNAGGGTTFAGGYHLSTTTANWNTAKAACESASSRLVIIDSQQEKDNLLSLNNNQDFNHWIGLTCDFGRDCTWIDGRRADSGYQSWAEGEPNDEFCVYMGWLGNNWDDTRCSHMKLYICEKI